MAVTRLWRYAQLRHAQRAYISQGQWPPISEQIIREGQHNPLEKHTSRYAVRGYPNVCTRIAHTTCNVRLLVAVRVTLFKDRVRPISEEPVVCKRSETEGESGGG